jgi:hypothetical protein
VWLRICSLGFEPERRGDLVCVKAARQDRQHAPGLITGLIPSRSRRKGAADGKHTTPPIRKNSPVCCGACRLSTKTRRMIGSSCFLTTPN